MTKDASGGAHRPVLVLVHGWGMGPGVWGAFAEALEAHFEVKTPALPGHGGEPEWPSWTVNALADRWCERWPDAVWVGWSLGAQVALAAALGASGRARGLVLIGATPRFLAAPDWRAAMARDRFRAFQDQCRSDAGGTRDRFMRLVAHGDEGERETLRHLRRALAAGPAPTVQGLLAGLDVLRDTDLRARLSEVRCPTLWLAGDKDAVVPAAAATLAAGSQPDARVSCLPGAGHAPFIRQPCELRTLIRDWFLDRNP